MTKWALLLVAASAASVVAYAEDEVVRDTCYLTNSVSGSGKGCATTNAAWWAIGSETGAVLGKQGEMPPADNDYVVRGGRRLQFQGDGRTFTCHSLQIGDLQDGTQGIINAYTKKTTLNVVGELIAEKGTCDSLTSAGAYTFQASRLTVRAPVAAPFQFAHRYNDSSWTINTSVYGAEGTGLSFGFKGKTVDGSWIGSNELYTITGDWSNFAGTLVVTSLLARTTNYYGTKLRMDAIDMAGTLAVSTETIIQLHKTGTTRVGALRLGGNNLLSFASGAALVVTNAFVQQGVVHVESAQEPAFDGLTNDVALLTVPADAVIAADDFVLDSAVTNWSHLGAELVITTNADTKAQTLAVRYPPMVRQTVTDSDSFNRSKDGVPYANSMTNAAHWSDGKVPHAGAHYLVMKRGAKVTWLRTPQQTDGKEDTTIDFTFPGESLTIAGECGLTVFGAAFRAKQIYILDGGDIQNGQKHYPDIYAPIHLLSGTAYLSAYNGNTFNLYSNVTGSALLRLGSVSGSTSAPTGGEYLHGYNTNFFGTIEAGLRANLNQTNKFHTLYVDDERNFGGRLAAFNPTALRVHGPYENFTAKANVTFTTNYNRGIYFYNAPIIYTQSYRMTFKTPIGVNGTLYKKGSGTLELGGPLAFADAIATEPTPGSNTLDVCQGTLAVSALDAVNGLAIAFSNNTELVLMPDLGDADFTRWGIRNVKTPTPFTLAAGNTVSFNVQTDQMPTRKFTLGLITVPNTETAVASARQLVETPAKIFAGTRQSAVYAITDSTANVVTLAVDISLPGTAVILR